MANNNYIDGIFKIDQRWIDSCCSCHISPPCGFCTRYADANLVDPEYCDVCGNPSPEDESLFYECSQCGKHICNRCCCGVGTICID